MIRELAETLKTVCPCINFTAKETETWSDSELFAQKVSHIIFFQMPGYDNRTGKVANWKYTGCAELVYFCTKLFPSVFKRGKREMVCFGFLGKNRIFVFKIEECSDPWNSSKSRMSCLMANMKMTLPATGTFLLIIVIKIIKI